MKRIIFTIFLMFLTITMVNAESITTGYSLLVRKGEVTESFSTSEVTSETKNIFNNAVSFSNSFIRVTNLTADRLSITDASATLSGPLSMTITGDNTVNVLTLTSCSLSVSGTGTLKFVPSYFGEEGIITNVEEQKQFVSSRIKTGLSITYEDGYVYINKPVVDTSNNETVNNTTDVTTKEDTSNNQVSTEVNNSSSSSATSGTVNSNTNTNNNIVNDTTTNSEIDDTNNNDIIDSDSDTENIPTDDVTEDEVEDSDDVDLEESKSNETKTKSKTNNTPLYVGVAVGCTAAVAGGGFLIFKKFKH